MTTATPSTSTATEQLAAQAEPAPDQAPAQTDARTEALTPAQIRKQRDDYRNGLEWFAQALRAHTSELEAPAPKLTLWAEHIEDLLRRKS